MYKYEKYSPYLIDFPLITVTMSATQLKPEAAPALTNIIQKSVGSIEKIPGLSVSITNKNGDNLYTHAAGYTDATAHTPITEENTFWIASTTKILVTVAVLQLVEQGKLRLDDSEQVENLVPELAKLPIVSKNEDGSLKLTPKKNGITLRHLLSHTAGFSYSFFNDIYKEWSEFFHLDEFNVKSERELQFPLLFELGTNWSYGVGIDWAGVALERYTGEKLGYYIEENIIKPLGMNETTFEPCEKVKKSLVNVSFRDKKTGNTSVINHPYKKFFADDNEKFHSGGAGLVSKPKEYVKFFSTILNDGVSPLTGNRILKKETVDLMFENQIPQFPDFGRAGIPGAKPDISNDIPDIYPEEGNPPQGWGLSFFLFGQKGQTGHAAKTGFWCGITNNFYWVDRETGLSGLVATNLLPFGDTQVISAWFQIEKTVYDYIAK